MKNSLIRIKIGDPVIYTERNEKVTVIDMVLSPNGVNDPSFITLMYVRKENGGMMEATANRFTPCDDYEYEGFWPTPHMFNLDKK